MREMRVPGSCAVSSGRLFAAGASRSRTASGSNRMLTLNCALKAHRIEGLNVASGLYRSRFRNTHFFRRACATSSGLIGKTVPVPHATFL